MNLQSRVSVWVAVCVVAAFVGGAYLFAQQGTALPQTSIVVRQPGSVAKASPTLEPSVSINPTPTPIPSAAEVPAPSDWKTYRNTKYGFEFSYPEAWTDAERDLSLVDYFTRSPQISVLDVGVAAESGRAITVAESEIHDNHCQAGEENPSDHVITSTGNGVTLVLYCSATSENYDYLFEINKGGVLRLRYHDDFDESWPEARKLTTLSKIISTLKLF